MAQPIKVDNVDVVLYTDVRRVNHGIGGKEVMHVDDFHVAPGARANTNGERAGARSNDECPDVIWRACTGNTVHGGRNFVTRRGNARAPNRAWLCSPSTHYLKDRSRKEAQASFTVQDEGARTSRGCPWRYFGLAYFGLAELRSAVLSPKI
ncbi:hypothetical protein BKA82DRAFT_4020818 [Pisolithus tinctorius]|nr:hypothetical protein BKA82DRAFT_4020818 [Pisolithus tinctorius]